MQETHNMKNSELIKRFIPYYKPFWIILILDLICASLTAAGELVLPPIISNIINLAKTDLGQLTTTYVFTICGIYVLLRLIDSAAYYYMATRGHIMGVKLEANMRMDLFKHLQSLPISYYNTTKVGQLMARITSDLFDVTEFAHHCPEEFWIATLKFVVAFSILVKINVPLTLLVFAMLPIMYVSTRYFSKKMRAAFKESRHQVGEINSKVEDSLLGVRLVQSFANESNEISNFGEYNNKFIHIRERAYKYMGGFHTITRLFDGLMYIIVILVGALFLIKDSINVGDYVAYILFVSTLLGVVKTLIQYTEAFQRGMTGIERFFEIMDIKSDIVDAEDAIELEKVYGNISFKNVSFRYDEKNPKIFHDICEEVPAGSNIAIVGPSGGGKSTLVNLLPRFYNLSDGLIEIDGVDIKTIKISNLRNNIGMVQQDVYLFSSTIIDNIRYGKLDASMEEIIAAAKQADIHDFIMSLPEQYDTYIGERGLMLSGGQKQRISIARVFLKNPPILILDEATSALDNESERLVQESLNKLAKGRTTFTIAHRLSTIRNADCIWVLNENGIVEKGSHEELLNKNGLYYQYHKIYSGVKND